MEEGIDEMATSKAMDEMATQVGFRQSAIDEGPGCAFGLVTRKGLDDLAGDVERLEGKINGILLGVVVTVLLQAWKTLG